MNRTDERPVRGASQAGRSEDNFAAAAKTPPPVLADDSTAEHGQTPSTDDRARRLIAAADGPIPPYGTPAFERLPEGPTKTASTVIAAQRWHHRRVVETVTARRARELIEARQPRPGDFPGGRVPLWGPGGAA